MMTTNMFRSEVSTTRTVRLIADENVRFIDRRTGSGTANRKLVAFESSQVSEPDVEVITPIPIPPLGGQFSQDTKPIQIWEGVVLSIDPVSSTVSARLNAKIGNFPEHTADIELEWVHEQDVELIKPGAIFYLTLFKKLNRASVQNAQEIRFRRLPNWSNDQIRRVHETGESLAAKMKIANVCNGI
jgi:hypothetical protein